MTADEERHSEIQKRGLAWQRLEHLSEQSQPDLVRCLQLECNAVMTADEERHSEIQKRGLAWQRLEHLSEQSQPDLVRCLQLECNAVVRHEAAFLLGDVFSHCRDTCQALIQAAADKSALVRHEVALALAHFPNADALHCLVNLLRDDSVDVRCSAELALLMMLSKPFCQA